MGNFSHITCKCFFGVYDQQVGIYTFMLKFLDSNITVVVYSIFQATFSDRRFQIFLRLQHG